MFYNLLLYTFNLPQLSPLFQFATIISEHSFVITVIVTLLLLTIRFKWDFIFVKPEIAQVILIPKIFKVLLKKKEIRHYQPTKSYQDYPESDIVLF